MNICLKHQQHYDNYCVYCGVPVYNTASTNNVLSDTSTKNITPTQCKYCKKECHNYESLGLHIEEKHK